MSSVPPKQSVYSGVCHHLVLTPKIAIGFRSGVRHRLTLMFKITIRLTLSRPLIYYKCNIYNHTCQTKKNDRENSIVTSFQSLFSCLSCRNCHSYREASPPKLRSNGASVIGFCGFSFIPMTDFLL